VNAPDFDVAIVGCGPVGATLAGLLAQRGVRTIAFDREPGLYPLPRAAHIDDETLRILQEIGAAEEILATVITNDGMDFLSASREQLLSMNSPTQTLSGWPASMMFHQPSLENAIRHAAQRHGAEFRLDCEVTEVRDAGETVQVTFGSGETLSAAFVVGCDGARSMVRQQINATMTDAGFEQRWLVLDLRLDPDTAPPTTRAVQVCDPARPHTLIPMPGDRFRFEFMLLPGETDDDINTPEQITTMLSAWMDPDNVEVERHAIYTFHGLVASPWRNGRVLLAGDAAHQMPPFLGQGMCSGLRDAANLAWKLHRVILEGAPDALLDTYEIERSPHVQSIVDAAVFFGRMICTTDQEEAANRDTALLASRSGESPSPTRDHIPPLGPGPLILAGGGGAALQVEIDSQRSDDLFGPHLAVIFRGPVEDSIISTWERLGAVCMSADQHVALQAVLNAAQAEAMVIRPDRRVMWAADSLSAAPQAVSDLLGTAQTATHQITTTQITTTQITTTQPDLSH
jgi:3-(3-hydroxy-phenyl)propionate hydroxylase